MVIGQIFILCTITWFSPVITTTITTTRKFCTISLSFLFYGHSLHPVQWIAIAMVFAGLYLSIRVQQQQRQSNHYYESTRVTELATASPGKKNM
jgi:UDP-galactose transporter B1